MTQRIALVSLALLAGLAACKDKALIARADTLQTKLSEQEQLSSQLTAQKDSLTRVVLDADAFIGRMDSAISTVKGVPRAKRAATDPLAAQIQARKDVEARVDALVARATQTARQLAALQKKEAETQAANSELRDRMAAQAAQLERDAQLIADLGSTIERQRTEIASLGARIDSLDTEIRTVSAQHYKAYYVIGTEKELIAKGIVTKEGGVNFLVTRRGRTLVPNRVLDPTVFTAIDQRDTKRIAMPDSTHRYRIVSRQSLDDANVTWRDRQSFRGDLEITKPDEFWAQSRYLILVKL
jgi:hypothetical protein